MSTATRILSGSGLALLGAGVIGMAMAESSWITGSIRLMRRVREQAGDHPLRTHSLHDLEGLPEPVGRYFRHVLTPGQPIARSIYVRHRGSFRMGEEDGRWVPFASRQQYATRPRAFVWDASLKLAPLIRVRVRDAYVDGHGSMKARLGSVIPLMNERGRPEIDSGALHRWLAEAVWFPTALLPTEGVEWRRIDRQSARATVKDEENEVSLEFTFGDRGEIVRAFTPERMRDVGGRAEPTGWVCHYHDYHRRGPVTIPERGEVEWVFDDHRLSYWRGRVERIEFV